MRHTAFTRSRTALLALCASTAVLYAGCAQQGSSSHLPSTNQQQAHSAKHKTATNLIQHIVVIVQENRSVDNIFNGFPGADTAQSGFDSHGNLVTLSQISFANTCGPGHSHGQFVTEYNNGSMNNWDQANYSCNLPSDTLPHGVFAYVKPTETAGYWQAASNYALADEVLQTNQGPSFPAHQYLIAGQAGGHGTDAPWAFAENGPGSSSKASPRGIEEDGEAGAHGCGARADIVVTQIDMTSPYPGNEGNPIYPCKDYQTIFDEAMAQSPPLTWKYYAHRTGNLWSGPDAVQHLWQAGLHATIPETQVLSDIANHQLANIVYVTPSPKNSDHPHGSFIQPKAGPKWVAQIVNAIGKDPTYWNNTTILVTWDDWGGWFDHVTPGRPPGLPTDPIEWGFRVPLVVISPYVIAHNVDHMPRTFNSITAYIESTFGLNSLGFQDSEPNTDDLSDMFNYSQTPLQFIAMPTK